jgi:hypothetical protein
LLNPFDQSPFFTSDFPAAVEETRDWRVVNRIVPLAPHVAIRIRPDISINRKRADFSFANCGYLTRTVSHRELVEINQLIVRCAEDTIFYRDEFAWVRKFITKNRHYRVDLIISKRRMGEGSLLVSTTRVVEFER